MRRIWRKVCELLRSNRGEAYIDAAVFILIAGLALTLVISVFGVSWRKTSAQGFADYAARQIAADGAFSGGTIRELTQVAGNGHFSIRVTTPDGYSASFPITAGNTNLPTKEIQEGTAFTVEISSLDSNTVGVNGVKSSNVAVYGAANGVSARYWKG